MGQSNCKIEFFHLGNSQSAEIVELFKEKEIEVIITHKDPDSTMRLFYNQPVQSSARGYEEVKHAIKTWGDVWKKLSPMPTNG